MDRQGDPYNSFPRPKKQTLFAGGIITLEVRRTIVSSIDSILLRHEQTHFNRSINNGYPPKQVTLATD